MGVKGLHPPTKCLLVGARTSMDWMVVYLGAGLKPKGPESIPSLVGLTFKGAGETCFQERSWVLEAVSYH